MHKPHRLLYLDAQALTHNLQRVRDYAPHAKILAMVKANAYGHGLLWVAEVLTAANVDALGVAVLEEAIRLREAGIKGQIVLADGVQSLVELQEAQALGVTIVLHKKEDLVWVEQLTGAMPLSVWLKVDTGMRRLGFGPYEIPRIYHQLMASNRVTKPITLMTHFSDADDLTKTKTQEQTVLFNQVHQELPGAPLKSLANSAAIMAHPETHGHWVRPGIMLYGASPFSDKLGRDFDLQAVMTVQSTLIAIHDYPAGSKLGYGEFYTCPKNMRVGMVAFGYGDGYPRMIQNSSVLIDGKITPIIARVSMDMLQVDLSDIPNAFIGQTVTLWGKDHPIEWVAQAAGTISYEIFCHLQQTRLTKSCF